MATDTILPTTLRDGRWVTRRTAAALFVCGGLLMATGGRGFARGSRARAPRGPPVLDEHVLMQVIASPAVGLTGAFVAVAVARAARTRPAQVLAAFAVAGGLLSAAAGPLVVWTGDPRFTILFPFQAGLAIWLIVTGVRLWRR